MPVYRSLLTFALPFAVAAAVAQSPTWSTLAPPGGVDPTKLSASDNLVVYRDGTYLRVWSPMTGAWHAHTPSFGTTPLLEADLLLVPESDRWTAFSAYRGVFETLLVNRAGAVERGSDSLFVVREGSTAHVFSAFTGRWHSHPVPAAWRMSLSDGIVAFFDGQYLSGSFAGASVFRAFTGNWHDVPARAETFLGAELMGGTALVGFPSQMIGFSNQISGAMGLPAPSPGQTAGASSIYFEGEVVVLAGTVFSGGTGASQGAPFSQPPSSGQRASYRTGGTLAHATQGAEPWFVAGLQGQWVSWPAKGRIFSGPGSCALMEDGSQLHAFSAVTGSIATTTVNQVSPYTQRVDRHVIGVTDTLTGIPSVFSSMTGAWHAAPANVVPSPGSFSSSVRVGATSAIFITTSGLTAFSARTGNMHELPIQGLQPVTGWSAAVGAVGPSAFYGFDPIRERWLQTPMAAPSAIVSTSGARSSTMLAEDTGGVVGFASRTGSFGRLALSEPVLDRGVRGDLAWVRTASHVHVFSGVGDHVSWAGFPDDLRACGMGSALFHQLRLASGDAAILGYGPRAQAPWVVPGLGEVWLEPSLAALEFVGGSAGEHRVARALPIPLVPALRGSEWFLQSLVTPAAAAPFVTEPVPFRIY